MIFIFNIASAAPGIDADVPDVTDDPDEIVVTGTRTPRRLGEAPVAVTVIDRAAIEASGSRDLAALLEQQPGIAVDRGLFGAALRLRGLEPVHTLVLVDGQRVVGRKDGTLDLSRLPVDSIERVEIVEGAASALYGSDALGGVVNIVTRRARSPRPRSAPAARPLRGDAALGLATGGERGGLRFDGGWHGAAPWDATPADPATTGNALEQLDGALRADWRPTPDLTLGARGAWTGTDARGVDLATGGAVLDRRNLTEDALVRGDLAWLPDARSRLTAAVGASVFRDQYVADQRDAAPLDTYQETRETLTQLDAQLDRLAGPHRLTLGLEGDAGLLRSDRLDGGRGQRLTGAVYVQDEVRLAEHPRLVAVPGLRGDLDSWFGGALAPSLGLRLDPVRTLTLRGSAGSGWRAPSFRELLLSFDNAAAGYRVAGNPDLDPERSLSLTLGAEWTPAPAVSLSLSAHQDRLHDLVQIGTLDEAPGLVTYGYLNVAEARTRGLDLGTSLQPGPAVGLDASLTLLDADDLTADRPLEGRAPVRGTLALRLAAGADGPRLTARSMLVGPRPLYLDAGRVDAPPHALVDLRLEQPVSRGMRLSAGVDNLLGAGDPQLLPVPPRLVYAGLDLATGAPR
ncbi:MAG: TonB-dependent receptor [Myxococcota bacterium]